MRESYKSGFAGVNSLLTINESRVSEVDKAIHDKQTEFFMAGND